MAASINRFCSIGSSAGNSVRKSSRLIPCLLNCNAKTEFVYSFRRCYNIPSTKRSTSQNTDNPPRNDVNNENPGDLEGFYPEISRFPIFDHMVKFRRKQAACSVVVQVSSSKSAAAAKDACKYFGEVKDVLHCSLPLQEILVVEFQSKDSVRKLKKSIRHADNANVIPSVSPFVWLKARPTNSKSENVGDDTCASEDSIKDLRDQLINAKSISDQIGIYHRYTRISDVNQRLRWITCHHIEEIFSGLFPHVQVHPFGSSINGCGRNGSDVDMFMSFDNVSSKVNPSPIMFQAKASKCDGKAKIAKEIELIANFLQYFATGYAISQKIPHARVPIIKFRQEMTNLDCDLSLTSQTAVPMSELIYLFGEMDWRVRPLIFAVRLWAETSRLTRSVPGHTITNFSLTLMVIFYLQTLKDPILPSLNDMITAARPDDRRMVAEVDCTFLRDPSIYLERARRNTQSLEDLLAGFLRYWNDFQYSDHCISIVAGRITRKPKMKPDSQQNPLYIQNPLDRDLNVSRNVTKSETLRIAHEAFHALHRLENCSDQDWGILSLMKQYDVSSTRKISLQNTLRDIFKVEEEPVEGEPDQAAEAETLPAEEASPEPEDEMDKLVTRMQAIVKKSEKKSKGGNKTTQSKGV